MRFRAGTSRYRASMTETRAQSGPRTEMTQIQVSLPNGAVKCVLGPPGADEQAGGSSAVFAGAPAAATGPFSLEFTGASLRLVAGLVRRLLDGRGARRRDLSLLRLGQPRSLIDTRKKKQCRSAGRRPGTTPRRRRRETKKKDSNHQSLRRKRAPIATPAPPPSVQPPPPRRPGPSS